MKLEESIKYLMLMKEKLDFNKQGFVYGADSVDTVLQALENYQIKELQCLNNKLDNISATELKVILQPYYIKKEKIEHQDILINELRNKLNNSIPKEVIEKKLNEIENMIDETTKGKLQKYTVGELILQRTIYNELLEGK